MVFFNVNEEQIEKSNLQDVFFDYAPNPFQFNQILCKYSLFFEGEFKYKKLEILAGLKFINLKNYSNLFKASPNLTVSVDDEVLYKKVIARAYGLNFNLKYNIDRLFCNFSYALDFARKKLIINGFQCIMIKGIQSRFLH